MISDIITRSTGESKKLLFLFHPLFSFMICYQGPPEGRFCQKSKGKLGQDVERYAIYDGRAAHQTGYRNSITPPKQHGYILP